MAWRTKLFPAKSAVDLEYWRNSVCHRMTSILLDFEVCRRHQQESRDLQEMVGMFLCESMYLSLQVAS